jgi:hypothetical protein
MGVYFEGSWAILSTIGIGNVLYGLVIISITRFSVVVAVPLVVSIATALANGLCYYAFYESYPPFQQAVASGFADVFWLIQEVGLSFYGYAILMRVLSYRDKRIFMALFWTVGLAIVGLRMVILVRRIQAIINTDDSLQTTINHLHVGYFVLIALLECISALFLLRKFTSAKRASANASLRTGLLKHFMRGTEIRVATLSLIGISRAVTYFFQTSLQAASSTASQIDRFIYTLECLFPMMFYIDVLASRIKFTGSSQNTSYRIGQAHASPHERAKTRSMPGRTEHRYPGWEEIRDEPFPIGLRSISRVTQGDTTPSENGAAAAAPAGITKTVEVKVYGTKT